MLFLFHFLPSFYIMDLCLYEKRRWTIFFKLIFFVLITLNWLRVYVQAMHLAKLMFLHVVNSYHSTNSIAYVLAFAQRMLTACSCYQPNPSLPYTNFFFPLLWKLNCSVNLSSFCLKQMEGYVDDCFSQICCLWDRVLNIASFFRTANPTIRGHLFKQSQVGGLEKSLFLLLFFLSFVEFLYIFSSLLILVPTYFLILHFAIERLRRS